MPSTNPTLPAGLRDPLDFKTSNIVLQESVLEAFKQSPAQSYGDHTLQFSDFSYPEKKTFTKKEQKEALLSRNDLSIPLKGTVTLIDNKTKLPVAQRRTTIMRVPVLSERGTYIRGGSEYSLAFQKRLRPGVYTRKTNQDEFETFIKTKGGSGFNIVMEPDTGELSFKIYNSKTPMYAVMRGIGMGDDEIKETLGDELFKLNYKPKYQNVLPKLWKKVTRGKYETDDVERDLIGEFEKMELDESTTRKTLGSPHKVVNRDVFKSAINNLMATYRGERDVDDRDSFSFQRVLGAEDIFSEAILKDKANVAKNILYKAQYSKDLKHVHANMFKSIPDYVFSGSRLAIALEEINPLDALDGNVKITGMGDGGFGSEQGVPDTARMVTPTQLGYVDIIRSPESGSVGVDGRLAIDTYKGVDGNLYSKFLDRAGKPAYVSSSDIDDLVIAFPGDASKVAAGEQVKVRAVNKGLVDYVDPSEVDYTLPAGQQMFSQAANLIPYISGVKGMRGLMGCLRGDSNLLILRDGQTCHYMIQHYKWQQGDKVLSMSKSYEPATTISWEPVRGVIPNYESTELIKINLNNNYTLETTPNHRWVTSTDAGLLRQIQASDLIVGDVIPVCHNVGLTGNVVTWKTIETIERFDCTEVTYDLDVNDKTFIANGIVIHNSKYTNQALSLVNREAPLVQSLAEDGESFHNKVGEKVGVIRPKQGGRVVSVDADEMTVEYLDGTGETFELYNDFLLNRKSALNQYPLIQAGEMFKGGQALTDSNYSQGGTLALGTNLRVGYMDMKGFNHEDAAIISETAAEKLTSEHLYNEKLDLDKSVSTDLGKFMSIFAGTYTKDQLSQLSDEGVIKPGATVNNGDPLIINMKKRSHKGLGMIGGGQGSQWRDNTVTWTHEHPGTVTDVWHDDSGIKLAVKSLAPMHIGDKLCFSEDHELFTINRGWQNVEAIQETDELMCLNLDSLTLESSKVATANSYTHDGPMVTIDKPEVSMRVTLNHKLVASWDGTCFGLYTAKELMQADAFWLLAGGEMLPVLIDPSTDMVIEDYNGSVYCPTLKEYNTLLVRRDNKVHWSGNSGAYGNKGIISKILPDEEMPKDSQGRPLEYLVNPFGTIGRHNPTQIHEAQLGKVAEVTGQPYILPGFSDEDATTMVQRELDKHGLSATETLTLPEGREVDNVQTGIGYYMKLHHMSESKKSEVGEGAFNMNSVPTTAPGGDKPKRVGSLEMEALLAHGAPEIVTDSKLIRGQENREYFKDLMDGKTPKMPRVSPVYKKFISTLQSAGVDITPVDNGDALQLSALTDAKVSKLSSGEITTGDTVKWKSTYNKNLRGEADLDPVEGGLFDRGITGGMGGNRYSHITMPVKLPQPVFEKQIRAILGLTEKNLHQVITGSFELGQFGTGPQALEAALADIDVEKKIDELSGQYKTAEKPSVKDKLAKQLKALKGVRAQGIKPSDLLTSKALVLPPIFRPVSISSDFEIVADANLLYKDLLDAKKNYYDMEGVMGEDMRAEALLDVYKAYRAVTGLGQPIKKERVEKKVHGLLADVFGPNGNKTSMVQRNLTGTPTSYSARGVIIPDSNLTLDEIGLPWSQSWALFEPFVTRRLLAGTDKSPEAKKKVLEDIKEERPNAKKALLDEMAERPVAYSRAPVLHKYGMLAAYAKPVAGNAIRSNIPTLIALGGDYDGDQVINFIFCLLSPEFLSTVSPEDKLTLEQKMISKENVMTKNAVGTVIVCDIADFPYNKDNMTNRINGENGLIEVFSVPEGVSVAAYNEETGGHEWKQAATWSIHYQREIEVVNLRNKKQIFTDNDPRAVYGITAKTGSLECHRATPTDALESCMLVPCRQRISSNLTSNIQVLEIDATWYTETASGHSKSKFYKLPLVTTAKLTEELGYFVGASVGDGWTDAKFSTEDGWATTGGSYGSFHLANIDQDIVDAWAVGANQLVDSDVLLSVYFNDNTGNAYGKSHRYSISNVQISRLLYDWMGKGAEFKHLPHWFFNANEDCRYGMLAGLLDTDGAIASVQAKSKKNPQLQVAYHTRSITLAREVKLLCETLGIRAGISTYKGTNTDNDMWVLSINPRDVQSSKLYEYLQCSYKRQALVDFPKLKENPTSARFDLVPVTMELLKHLKRGLGKLCSSGDYGPTKLKELKSLKTTLAAVATPAKFAGYTSRVTALKCVAELSREYVQTCDWGGHWMSIIDNQDITWSPIDSVDKSGIREDGYDLTVPGLETFLSADGVTLSNTFQLNALITPEAVQAAKDKMLPSKHLFSVADFELMHTPEHGFNMGIYDLAGKRGKTGRLLDQKLYKNREELMAAYSRGEVDLEDDVLVEDARA